MAAGVLAIVGIGALVLMVIGAAFLSSARSASPTATWTRPPSTVAPQPTPTPTTTRPTPTPTPTTTRPRPTPRPTTPKPTPVKPLPDRKWEQLPGPHSNHPTWVTLQRNRIYSYDIPVPKCPATPAPFTSRSQFRTFATNYLNCQHNAWLPVFKRAGRSLPKPKVVFFNETSTLSTRCGTVKRSRVSFYCGHPDYGSYTIFVNENLMTQSNNWWRLRAAETLSHEYGHHVQQMSSILGTSYQLQGSMSTNEISRRIELQTSCWSMRMLYHTKSLAFTRRDHDIIYAWTARDQDAKHGSAASMRYWSMRGLYMSKISGCNTWVVGSNAVR